MFYQRAASKTWTWSLDPDPEKWVLKNKSEEMHNCFKQLRNFCVFLIKKAKPNYYETLDLGNITYSKIFWNKIKPLLSGDVANSNNIILAFGLKQVSSQKILRLKRCVKNVLVRSYSGPYFPAFGLNADQNNSE